jgi:hypothetical protein
MLNNFGKRVFLVCKYMNWVEEIEKELVRLIAQFHLSQTPIQVLVEAYTDAGGDQEDLDQKVAAMKKWKTIKKPELYALVCCVQAFPAAYLDLELPAEDPFVSRLKELREAIAPPWAILR